MSLHEDVDARLASGMRALESRIRAAHVPPARAGNLRLATWNIRELGKHPRLDESIHLISAILRVFDLVAIIELRDDLGDLRRILRLLGPKWGVVFSDYLADAAGNRERVGFVFNRDRVAFTGLASTVEEPRRVLGTHFTESIPWWRPPFMASFAAVAPGSSRSFEFLLLAAHVRWGGSAKARRGEIAALADWLRVRAKEKFFGERDVIVAGDFNVQLSAGEADLGGLTLAPGLTDAVKTDLAHRHRYDHILSPASDAPRFSGNTGVLDFCSESRAALFPHRRLSAEEFTLQMSDHLPLWVELTSSLPRAT